MRSNLHFSMRFTLILYGFMIFLISGCGTLQAGIYHTPTPDTGSIATLASIMYQGTRLAAIATQLALPSTPTPGKGTVRGSICYPSGRIPAMTVYFRNLLNDQVIELPIDVNQENYHIELEPGKYYAYAWVSEYQLGGMYTQAVPCGLKENECTDHRPLSFDVSAGTSLQSIDLCDWAYPVDKLPLPVGVNLK